MKRIFNKVLDTKPGRIGRNFLLNPLFSGSAVMIFGSNLANFIAYVYHLIIGRLLGPAPYGELSAVLSILGLIFASLNFLGLVIVKFVSSAEKNELASIYTWFTKKSVVAGIGMALLTLILTPSLSNFLHIKMTTFLLTVPIMSFSVTSYVYKSFLQGLMRFKETVVAVNTDMIIRLILGVVFIYLGLSSFGTVLGLVFSMGTSFLLLKYYLREYHSIKEVKVFGRTDEVLKYATPIFFATVATNSMFSTDVVLVKHFFSPHDAGIYASLSTLGKIIFFGAGPVAAVMFPMISKRHARGTGYKKIFLLSFLLTSVIAFGVLAVFWLLPELSVKILYGDKFIEGAPLLVWMGLFMVLFTLSSLILNYFLSTNKTKASIIVVAAALLQIIGIWFYHDTLLSVIRISLASSFLFLASLLIYYGYEAKKGE